MLFSKKYLYKLIFPLLFLSSLFLSACHSKDVYQYQEGLNLFMIDAFDIDLRLSKGEHYYFFVDGSCGECIQSKINKVSDYSGNFKTNVVFLGDTTNLILPENLTSSNILFDLSPKYQSYETGIGLPLLLKMKNGYSSRSLFVTDFNSEDLSNFFKE